MRLLLDQGLPRSTVIHLHRSGIDALHVGDRGLATETDEGILELARKDGRAIVTLDADFHSILAITGAANPSVIRIRIEGLRAEELADLLLDVLEICEENLMKGAMVSVTEHGIRIRGLPLVR